jgi:hypothetical protein
VVRADVDGFADGAVATRQRQKSAAGVGDIVEIPRGSRVPEFDLFRAAGYLGDDGRDHRTRGLSRPVGIEGPRDGERQVEGVVETQSHCVRADFRSAVR